MRILYLGNNRVGAQVVDWLREQGEQVVGVVVHPDRNQKYREAIIRSAAVDAARVFFAPNLGQPEVLAAVRSLAAEIAVSVFFGYILRSEFVNMFPVGCINLHPSLLPYNRGAHPNVWSIVDGTPAGATLHYIDRGVDTGDIIAQREVEVAAIDTGETLYRRLEHASVELFKSTWPQLRAGRAPRIPQGEGCGTYHRMSDLEGIDEIDLDATYKARDLIDLIRARTFHPYPGAYFRDHGKKVFLRLELAYEEGAASG